jgi:glutamate/tyrosine decarboxylase-like PLP-dependent enzyme
MIPRDQIKVLEAKARELEPNRKLRDRINEAVLDYSNDFLDRIYELPAYVTTEDKGVGLYDSPITDEPIGIERALALLRQHVDRPGLNPASGGHIAYIPGGGIFTSAPADYLAAVTNRYAGVFYGSPGAVRMENMLLRWMADMVGYPESALGSIASGGSIANLTGIVTARDAHGLEARNFDRAVVYMTRQVHHCVGKALRIAGLGSCVKRWVDLDDGYRMRADALEQAIEKDKKDGLIPWLVIASAGTTDTGVVDPLETVGEIAEANGLWYHIDGAYGAFFALCEGGQKLLAGMDRSDSIVMDPHKGLFLPYGSGAVLVKEGQKLFDAHFYTANYMQDAMSSREELSPADLSPELTKHFRGLRLWLPLMLHGVAPFRAALEEKLLLARYFRQELLKVEGFEVGPEPDLSVVTFRYLPRAGDPNRFNRRIIEEVQRDGRVFLSSTMLEDRFILRLAVLAFRTHLDTIDLTLEILKQKVKDLESL